MMCTSRSINNGSMPRYRRYGTASRRSGRLGALCPRHLLPGVPAAIAAMHRCVMCINTAHTPSFECQTNNRRRIIMQNLQDWLAEPLPVPLSRLATVILWLQ